MSHASPALTLFELRRYRARTGHRDALIALFEAQFLPAYEATGTTILASFTVKGEPDHWVWVRAFADAASRQAALQGFYGGAVWSRLGPACNALLKQVCSSRVLRAVAAGELASPPPRETLQAHAPRPTRHTTLHGMQRRHWLLTGVAALAGSSAVPGSAAPSAAASASFTSTPRTMLDDSMLEADPPRLDAVPPMPTNPAPGKPGDFAFLDGRWRIRHLKRRGDAWDRFDGEARCWSILDGVGSVEELLIPARQFSGLGLRMLDVEKRLWNDHWVNAKSGVVGVPGLQGGFEAGFGLFPSTYEDQGKTMHSMGIWDCIAPGQCRWRQVVSGDGGRSWAHDWVMHWRRQA